MLVTVALLVVIVVMLVTVALLIVIVVMLVTVALFIVVVVVMVMLMMLLFKSLECICKSILLLHCGKNILAVKRIPRRCYDGCVCIMLAKKLDTFCNFRILCALGVRKHDGRSVLNLIVEELTEILHIHLTFVDVCNGSEAIELGIFSAAVLNRANNVGKLSNSGGLDDYSVGSIFFKNLNECLRKISYKRTADATRIHFRNFDSRVGKKASVNTDLTEFVLYKNNLLTGVRFLNKLLY